MWAFAPSLPRAQRVRAQDAAVPSAEPVPTGEAATPETPAAPVRDEKSIDVLKLTLDGGIFMIPLFGLSLLAATIAVERFIGLRRSKVLPNALVEELGPWADRRAVSIRVRLTRSASSILPPRRGSCGRCCSRSADRCRKSSIR